MRIVWSLPVPGESLGSSRGDVVRARHLAEGLRELGHEVRLVAAGQERAAAGAAAAYRGTVARILPGPAARVLRDAGRLAVARSHARRVAAAARELGARVLVETQVHGVPSGAMAARTTGIPLVLDDCTPAGEASVLREGLPGLARWGFRRQAGAAVRLVTSSRALARVLEDEGVDGKALAVVGNGVEPGPAGARPPDPDGPVTVVYAGSFQPWHRIDLLLEATEGLAASRPVELLLLGDGECRAPVLDEVERRGLEARIRAPGPIPYPELRSRLAACHIGVLAGTNAYGQPMKLLEYAAAGLPAVAPDQETVRELVRDGATGLLFPPGDASALRTALARLVDDTELRVRLGGAARKASRGMSWTERAKDLARVLEEAVS